MNLKLHKLLRSRQRKTESKPKDELQDRTPPTLGNYLNQPGGKKCGNPFLSWRRSCRPRMSKKNRMNGLNKFQ